MDKERLQDALLEALARHAFNDRAKQVIEEIAEDMELKLEPGRFEVEGYVFRMRFSKPNRYGVYTDASQVMLYESINGGDSLIDLEPYFNRAVGTSQWGGKKVKLTVEEVKD